MDQFLLALSEDGLLKIIAYVSEIILTALAVTGIYISHRNRQRLRTIEPLIQTIESVIVRNGHAKPQQHDHQHTHQGAKKKPRPTPRKKPLL